MPNYTKNLGLTKPFPEEFYDIGVHNANMDKIDAEVVKKTGDTMTGTLRVKKDSYPALWLEHTALNRECILEIGQFNNVYISNRESNNNENRTVLILNDEATHVSELLNVLTVINGDLTTYNVLHTGNMHLITPADIGAVSREEWQANLLANASVE